MSYYRARFLLYHDYSTLYMLFYDYRCIENIRSNSLYTFKSVLGKLEKVYSGIHDEALPRELWNLLMKHVSHLCSMYMFVCLYTCIYFNL